MTQRRKPRPLFAQRTGVHQITTAIKCTDHGRSNQGPRPTLMRGLCEASADGQEKD